MNQKSIIGTVISWVFGMYVLAQGILNMMRGNDFEFGVALALASLLYFPPASGLFEKWTGLSIHYGIKIVLALLIAWATLAVGAVNEGYYPEISG